MSGLFAASFPERTRALILYGTFAKLEPTTGLLARLAIRRRSHSTASRRGGDTRASGSMHGHRRVVRSRIEASDGHEVETAGDGFLVTFDAPAAGIRCARSIIEATSTLGLELRTGIHTGEREVSEDGIQGVAVHTAARAAARGGAARLVSRTVRELLSGAGIRFEDRGRHDLKGIPGRWELFSAEPDGRG